MINKAFLFAAGLGTRLRPYTFNTPKPLLKIYSSSIIEIIIRFLCKIGIDEFFINIFYLKEQFLMLKGLESELNIKIHFIEQNKLYHHGGDLNHAKILWEKLSTDENFLAINADTLFYIDKNQLKTLSNRVNSNTPLLILGKQTQNNPLTVSSSRLVGINNRFYQKEITRVTRGDSSGVYVMNESIKDHIGNTPEEEFGFFDMKDSIVASVIQQNKEILYLEPNTLLTAEIGTAQDYENYPTNMRLQNIYNSIFND